MTTIQKRNFAFIAIAIISGVSIFLDLHSKPNDSNIYDYLPYINGAISTLVGFYSFLLVFRIYKPKYKTPGLQASIDEMIKKRGNLLKFCSIVMLIYGTYNLVWHDPDMYRLNSRITAGKWTNRDKEIFIKDCLKKVGPKTNDHPEIVLDYCSCLINTTMKEMSKQQYIDDLSLSKQEQLDKFGPVFKGCKIIFNRKLDSVAKK